MAQEWLLTLIIEARDANSANRDPKFSLEV
jgi:hypothetical protein